MKRSLPREMVSISGSILHRLDSQTIGNATGGRLINRSITRIEFEPSNMYFKLPKNEYQNLDRRYLEDKLALQIKDFMKTRIFKTSFLAKADCIIMQFSGEKIDKFAWLES